MLNQVLEHHHRLPPVSTDSTVDHNQLGTHHTPGQPASQQRKPQEKHKPRLPRHPTTAVTEAVRLQTGLFDRVDDEHSKRRANAGDPVDELDVDERSVTRAVREGGRINQEEEAQGELHSHHRLAGRTPR